MATATRIRSTFQSPDVGIDNIGWREEALCRTIGAELWFSDKKEEVTEAMRLCESCPVRRTCESWAVRTGQTYGVWGGVDVSGRFKSIGDEW